LTPPESPPLKSPPPWRGRVRVGGEPDIEASVNSPPHLNPPPPGGRRKKANKKKKVNQHRGHREHRGEKTRGNALRAAKISVFSQSSVFQTFFLRIPTPTNPYLTIPDIDQKYVA